MVVLNNSLANLFIISAILLLLTAPSCMADNILYSGESLYGAQALTYGLYTFTMQTDCNLVLYESGHPVWASNSNSLGSGCYVSMQRDGNLVIYSNGNSLWASNTGGRPQGNYVLVLQKDRNVVIYGGSLWSTNTYLHSLTSNSTTQSGSGMVNVSTIGNHSVVGLNEDRNGDQLAIKTVSVEP